MAHSLHLQVLGKGSPLIMLHGWGWDSAIWEPLIPELTENFQLFLLDLPGFGKSPFSTTYWPIESLAATLLDVVPPQAAWLGWSLGGMIAWYMAIHHPNRVAKLITIASSPKFVSAPHWPGVSPNTLEKFSQLLLQDQQKTLHDFLELQLRGTPHSQKLLDNLHHSTSPEYIPALLSGLDLLHQLDLRADLAKLKCRSLHIFGNNDTIVPMNVVEEIRTLLPEAQYETINRSGHIPFLSQKENFLECLNKFLF